MGHVRITLSFGAVMCKAATTDTKATLLHHHNARTIIMLLV